MQTSQPTKAINAVTLKRDWLIIDAQDLVLGRAASQIASILRGKHKPTFTPNADTGDFVIVINADKIRLTGNKWNDKIYYHHSNYIGGLKQADAKTVHAKDGTKIVESAVRTMLRRSPLGRDMMAKLHVYTGPNHPHAAQQPKAYKLAF